MTQGDDNRYPQTLALKPQRKYKGDFRFQALIIQRVQQMQQILIWCFFILFCFALLFASSKCFICAFPASMLLSPYFRFLCLDGLWLKEFYTHQGIAKSLSFLDVEVIFCQLEGSAQVLYSIWNCNKQNCLTHTDKFLLCLPKRFQLKFNTKVFVHLNSIPINSSWLSENK